MRTKKKALIIGCGVAGPAAAIFLKRAGFEPFIYEAMPEHDDDAGLFLNVARNGMRILQELGVDGPIRMEGFETRIMSFRSGKGKWLGSIGQTSGEPQGFTIKRGFLHSVLREEAERQGIPVEFGKKLVDLQMSGDHATACFEDGTSAAGDFLVGCFEVRQQALQRMDVRLPHRLERQGPCLRGRQRRQHAHDRSVLRHGIHPFNGPCLHMGPDRLYGE